MDFTDDPEIAVWRGEVRKFLEDNKSSIPHRASEHTLLDPDTRKWQRIVAGRGWIAPGWPLEFGGAGLGVVEQFVLNEEFAEAEAPTGLDNGRLLSGSTIILHGTDEQRNRFLPAILGDEINWCQGFSEPGAGSDLASLQTTARRDGDDFVISGQKIWTSFAHEADWMFMLARTDPNAPKHRGITMFLIDMKSPGITVRPLYSLADTHGFNEVFLDDVRVPTENVVGPVDRGWYVSATTLDLERSAVGNAIGQRKAVERMLATFRSKVSGQTPLARLRTEVSERYIEANVAKLFSMRVAALQSQGLVPNHEASIAKLYNTELRQRISNTEMKIHGMAGLLRRDVTEGDHSPGTAYLHSPSATIAGGTSEIQRNIIATRGLGLPRG